MIVWLIVGFMLVYIVYKRSGKISGSIPSIGGGDMLIIVAALVVCGGLLWMTSVHAPVFWAAWCYPSVWTMIGSVVVFLGCAYLVWRHHTLAYIGMAIVIIFMVSNYNSYKSVNKTSSGSSSNESQQNVIYGTTPFTKTGINYGFNIEADDVIEFTIPGHSGTFTYFPGKGYQQFPTPRYKKNSDLVNRFWVKGNPQKSTSIRLYKI